MIVFPNAPFSHVPKPLQDRQLNEFIARLAGDGIVLHLATEDAVVLDLSRLSLGSGSVERGRVNLIAALEELKPHRIDVEPADVIAWYGPNALSHGLARGLQSHLQPYVGLLTSITLDELADRLDQALGAMCNDRPAPSNNPENDAWLKQHYANAAEADLRAHGLLDGDDGHDPWANHDAHMAQQSADPPEVPEAFRSESKPYRSPFEGY